MARTKKPVNYTEEMQKIDEQIAKYKAMVRDLEDQKKAFQAQKEKADLNALYQLVKDSGKSIDEIVGMIQA